MYYFDLSNENNIDGMPVARIIGGKYNDKILVIKKMTDEEYKNGTVNYHDITNPEEQIKEALKRDKKARKIMNASDQELILKHIEEGTVPTNPRIINVYEECMRLLTDDLGKSVKLKDGELSPCPNMEKDQVENLYICGPSGSGKSTYCSKWLEEFKITYPEKKLYLFSRKKEDPAFDNLDIGRVDTNPVVFRSFLDHLYENGRDVLDEFKDSCCVFDDIDVENRRDFDNEEVQSLRDDFLETGRSKGIYTVSTNHFISSWNKTRKCLNEATSITIFPGTGQKQIRSFLKEHIGLTREEIDPIMKNTSRWVTIQKKIPRYVIYDKGAYLL